MSEMPAREQMISAYSELVGLDPVSLGGGGGAGGPGGGGGGGRGGGGGGVGRAPRSSQAVGIGHLLEIGGCQLSR
ncbi:hypothetical protein, partial [Pseudomonas aeruginosa]|uniref:hypothetical protein n=1 Tax=Pseudomonas aeruginosa TaxID=287 RepID=UPI003916FD4C